MLLTTSKGLTYDALWAGVAAASTGNLFAEIRDERRLPEIAAEFDGLEWLETDDGETHERHEGFGRLVGINRTSGGVQVTLSKEVAQDG